MFDDNQEPKDMFADVPDKALVPAAAPAAQSQVSPSPVPTIQAQPQQTMTPAQAMQYDTPKSGGAGLRLVAVIAISLLCVGGAGYAAYKFMVRDAVSQQVSEVIGGGEEESVDEGTAQEEGQDGKGSESSTPTTGTSTDDGGSEDEGDEGSVAVVDSDGDGLSNDEERAAGTSVAKPDTDSDGLGDREEVKFYETDPKKADTDGDGYKDGEEVENGYNPNGDGRLLQVPE
jgi:hypothetical protein